MKQLKGLSVGYAPTFADKEGNLKAAVTIYPWETGVATPETGKVVFEDILSTTTLKTLGRHIGWIVETHLRENGYAPLTIDWDALVITQRADQLMDAAQAGFQLDFHNNEPTRLAPWHTQRTKFLNEKESQAIKEALSQCTAPTILGQSFPFDPFNL